MRARRLAAAALGAVFVAALVVLADGRGPEPAHAQGSLPEVSIGIEFLEVFEGAAAVFELSRVEGPPGALTVSVETWEQNRGSANSSNSTYQTHQVTIPAGKGATSFTVVATVDSHYEFEPDDGSDNDKLWARIIANPSTYTVISPSQTYVEINDPALVSIETEQLEVYEGAIAEFGVSRVDGIPGALTVSVETWEENRGSANSSNSTYRTHQVTIPDGRGAAKFSVVATPDIHDEPEPQDGSDNDRLMARVRASTDHSYTIGSPSTDYTEIDDPPDTAKIVSISADASTVAEGQTATFTLSRTGDTASTLSVDIEVDDPGGLLRGNHWDSEPTIPTTFTFDANSSSGTLSLPVPDDQRDLADADVTVAVVASADYLLGVASAASVSITDNDDAQELTLELGYIGVQDHWADAGANTEALFYNDDISGYTYAGTGFERLPVHFAVTRRAEDIGSTASFVVRLEHDRGWEDPIETGWATDSVTGKRYKEFALELEADEREVLGRILIRDNGLVEAQSTWTIEATIKPLVDAGGTELGSDAEAQYWTVNGSRAQDVAVTAHGLPEIRIVPSGITTVDEGDSASFLIWRFYGDFQTPLAVTVRTWEPNQLQSDGISPITQTHTVTFPVAQPSSFHANDHTAVKTLVVPTTDDTMSELVDHLHAQVLTPSGSLYWSQSNHATISIRDDDLPTISLAADQTSITEGGSVTFTLTRGHNTTETLAVGVTVDDPGGFLDASWGFDEVAVPSSVVFNPGDTTASVTITPNDDRRDIPDSTLTFTVDTDPAYSIVGASSATVQVADNDTAPQVRIRFESAEVDEGDDVRLIVERIGDTTNTLNVYVMAGPVGDQQRINVDVTRGTTQRILQWSTNDDDTKNADVVYEATLLSQPPEYWTMQAPATVTATVVDDDLYKVGVEIVAPSLREGQATSYRILREGHPDDTITVNVRQSETGSAVADTHIGDFSRTISAGSSRWTSTITAEALDGDDPDAFFTAEVLPGDGYVIDPARASDTLRVIDADPAPVLGLASGAVSVDEDSGTATLTVEMVSTLASLRTMTVDYATSDGTASAGTDYTATSGTLTFVPGDTTETVTVPITADLIAELDETFTVTFTNPAHATFQYGQTDLTATVTIANDEPTVTVAAANATVTEGQNVVFDIARTGATTRSLTVWLRIDTDDGTTTSTSQVRLEIPSGSSSVQHVIATVDDDVSEPSIVHTATVLDPETISEPKHYWTDPAAQEASVREGDNDAPAVRFGEVLVEGFVRDEPYDVLLIEGSTLTLKLRTLYIASDLTVTVQVTGGEGFLTGTVPTTVEIPRDTRSATLTLRTSDDSVEEDHGTVTVTIIESAGYRVGSPDTVTATILDDDGEPPGVGVAGVEDWVDEGDDTTFTVSRSGPTTEALDIRLRLYLYDDESRSAVEDRSLQFPVGTSSLTVTKSTDDDTVHTGDRRAIAEVLFGADDIYTSPAASTDAQAEVWVQDDDRPTVTLTPATGIYYEGSRPNVVLTRTGDTSRELISVDVAWQQTTHFPAPLSDFTGNIIQVFGTRIPSGQASYTHEVATLRRMGALGMSGRAWIVPDSCPDGSTDCGPFNNPHYCPAISGRDVNGGCGHRQQYLRGSDYEQTFRIYNNFMGVRIEAGAASFNEGDAATFTLHRHGGKPDAMDRPLHVKVAVTQDGDYISGTAPQTVTFTAGQATATLSIATDDDLVEEDDGSITVELLRPDSFTDDERAYEIGEYSGTPWAITTATADVVDDDYNRPTVSVADAAWDEDLGLAVFTISLSHPNSQEVVTVDWATSDDGSTFAATSGTDYTAASGTATFALNQTTARFAVVVTDDTAVEGDETFQVALSNPSEAFMGDGTATMTILDDELDFAVAISHLPDPVVEGQQVAVTVQRMARKDPADPAAPTDVCYSRAGQVRACFDPTAAVGATTLTLNLDVTQQGDFISGSPPTTVSFTPGSRFAVVRVPTADDNQIEATGTITVEIQAGSGYTPEYTGAVAAGSVDIYDNDLAITVGDATGSESSGQLDFAVRLAAPAPESLTVDVATVDGVATSHANVTATSLGKDFEAATQQLAFAAGDQQKTFSVTVVDDTIYEPAETFAVRLSNASLPSPLGSDAVGTITDDEQPMVASVSRTYPLVDEDGGVPARFQVDLSHPTTTAIEQPGTVAWRTTAGTATADQDYTAATGALTVAAGTLRGFIDVAIIDDTLMEPLLETFSVQLVAAGTQHLTVSSSDASSEAGIRDDDVLSAGVTANYDSITEGQNAVFTVELTKGASTQDVTVAFAVGGTATPGTDYGTPTGQLTLESGNATGTLTIPAGSTSGTITIPLLVDSAEDPGEEVEVRLVSATHGTRAVNIASRKSEASVQILDIGTLAASIQPAGTVQEGDTVTFTVILTKSTDDDVNMHWETRKIGDTLTGDETAVPGRDYTVDSGTAVVAKGSTTATFTITTIDDSLAEADETFRAILASAEHQGNIRTRDARFLPLVTASALATIVDNDDEPDTLSITTDPSSLSEGAGATQLDVTVSLGGTTQRTVDTAVTVQAANRAGQDANATLGTDYTATSATVTIPAGESSATGSITLTPNDDRIAEGAETAWITAEASGFTGDGTEVTITDNDTAPTQINLTVTPDSVGEDASSTQLLVTATFVGDVSRASSTAVAVEVQDGSAESGDDYSATTATVTIPAGSLTATATLTLTPVDDNIAEGAEDVEVTGSNADGIQVNEASVTITDNDTEPTSISLSANPSTVDEGDSATTVTVRASLLGGGTRSEATTVTLSTADVTATVTDDYTASWNAQTVTIPAGEFSATTTLTLTPVDDTLHEGSEQVAVSGTNSSPGLTVNGTLLTIEDDDPAPTTVALTLSKTTISESDGTQRINATATIQGGSTMTSDTPITATFVDSNGATSNVGSLLSQLIIDAGETSATSVLVVNADDDIDSAPRVFRLQGTTRNGLTVTPAILVITDDDTAGVTLSSTSVTVVEGQTVTYTVELDTQPTDTVTVTINDPTDNTDVTTRPESLTFTTTNWNTRQSVVVTSIQDDQDDDGETATVTHTVSSTGDTNYNGISVNDVRVNVTDDDDPAVTVSFEQDSYSVAEGSTESIKLVLSADPERTVTVPILRVNQNGATSADYSVPALVVFNSGDTEKTIDFAAVDDSVDDDGESVRLSLGTLPPGVTDGTHDSAVVSITNDDAAGLVLSRTSVPVDEGDSATFTVKLATLPTAAVTVTAVSRDTSVVSVTGGSSLTFTTGDWSTAQTVTVFGVEDNDAADETAVVDLEAAGGGYGSVAGAVTVSVDDDDGPAVTVSFEQDSYSVAEGSTESIKLVLSADPERTVTVPILRVNQNGATAADYSVPSQVVFNSGDTEKSIAFEAVDDSVDDDGESVQLWLGTLPLPPGVTEGTHDSAVVSIVDDDTAGLVLSRSPVPVDEGDSATFTVKLATRPTADVTVTAASRDTSVVSVTGGSSLTFTTGDWSTAQTVTVFGVEDADAIDTSTVVDLQAAGGGYGSVSRAVTVSVDDDDSSGLVLSRSPVPVDEGSTATFTVKLGTQPAGDVTVTATSRDTSAVSVSAGSRTLTFTTGDWNTAQTVRVGGVHDNDAADETAVVDLQAAGGGYSSHSAAVTVNVADDDGPAVTVSFEQDSYSVAEGSTESIKLTLSADPERTVTVPILKANQNGASAGDYSVPAQVVFNSGDTEKTIAFSAVDDSDDDDGESVQLSLGTLPPGVTDGTHDSAVVDITDDDGPAVTVSFEQGSYSVAEGASESIKLTLSADPERTVTVPILPVSHGGATSADYSVPSQVVFNSGDTEKTIAFSAVDDTVDDDGESVRLWLGTLPPGVTDGTHRSAVVNITDDDDPAVTVSFEQDSYSVAEGASESIKLVLSADPERTVTVPILRVNQNGATSADYSVPAQVVFNSGDTEKTIAFEAVDDSVDDDGESVRLSLGTLPPGVTDGTHDSAVVAITDDDAAGLVLSRTSVPVDEGDSATFTVKLATQPTAAVTVTAVSRDTSAVSVTGGSSLTFTTGDWSTAQTVTVFGVEDNDAADETAVVDLSGSSGGYGSVTGAVTVSVDDDDAAGLVLSRTSVPVDEGDSATFTVKLATLPTAAVTVTAVSRDTSVVSVTGGSSLTFTTGDWSTAQTVTVFGVEDNDAADETAVVDLEAAGGGYGSVAGAVTVSVDDDDGPAVTVSFEQDSYSVAEGSTESIKLVLSADPERTVTVPILRVNQNGATAADYSVPSQVVFNSGDTEKSIAFEAVDDSVDDDGESVQLWLGTLPLPPGVTEGTHDSAVVSIVDDDTAGLVLSRSPVPVDEGDSATFTVKLATRPTADVTVTAASRDTSVVSVTGGSSLTFTTGDWSTAQTVTVFGVEDADAIDTSTVVDLQAAGGGYGSVSRAVTVSVDDDDSSGLVLSRSPVPVDEGSTATFTVKLGTQPAGDVTVTATSRDTSAVSVSAGSRTLTFTTGDWNTAQTVRVGGVHDNDAADETAVVDLQAAGGGYSSHSAAVTVNVADDDGPAVTVSFEQDSYSVAEGSTESIKLTLSADPERTVTVPILKANQNGASAGDYSVPAQVVFNSGDTEKTIAFSAVDDSDDDDGESVQLSLGTLPPGVTDGTHDSAVVDITDDDGPAVTVSFEQGSYSVAEGASESIKLTLSADPERTVTVPILPVSHGGATSADYSVPSQVVFNSGDTEKTIAFSAVDDTVDDDGESVRLWLGTLPPGVTDGTHRSAVVNITDDDDPAVTVSFEQDSYSVAEGASESIKLVLSADPERTVTVPILRVNQNGATSADYSVPAQVVFNSGDTEKTIAFEAVDDSVDDDGESVRLSLGTLPPGVTDGTHDSAVVAITDDDAAGLVLSRTSVPVDEGDSATFTVKLATQPTAAVTVTAVSRDTSAVSVTGGSSLTFTTGDWSTAQTVTVFGVEDNDAADETAVVDLSGSSGGYGSVTGAVTVSVDDDDAAGLVLSRTSVPVDEGDSATFTVKLATLPTAAVTVTAVSRDTSVVSVTGGSSLTFTTGDWSTAQTVTVFGVEDNDAADETAVVDLEAAGGGYGSVAGAVTVSVDDDDGPAVTVSFEQDSYSVAEGSTESIKLVLSADPERTVTVPILRVNQNGATAADYSVPSQVVFNSGDTEKSIAFEAVDDSVDDDGESVQLWLGTLPLPPGVTEGTHDSAVVSIVDDDTAGLVLSRSPVPVDEGDSATFTVKLATRPTADVTVTAASRDTSVVSVTGGSSLTFTTGDWSTAQTVTVFGVEDADAIDTSTVVDLQAAGGGYGSVSRAVTVSVDDDDSSGLVLSRSPVPVDEGSTATFTVKLGTQPAGDVTVTATSRDTSAVSVSAGSRTLTFTTGDWNTAQTVRVGGVHDNDAADETAVVDLQAAGGGYSSHSAAVTVNVADDDGPAVTVSFEQDSYSVAEGSTESIKLTLSADPERTVTVPILKANQNGASAGDYSVPAQVVFNSGDTEKTIAFSAVDDSDDDDGESVQLSLGTLPPGVTDGTHDSAVVDITDDDGPAVTVSFEQGSYSVAEGASESIKLTLSADPERTVTVPILPVSHGGATSADYSVPSQVVFNSGDTEKTIAFSAVDDTVDDDGESVRLWLGTLPPGVTDGTHRSAVVNITDDDDPAVTVSFEQDSYSVAEGASESIKLVLSADPERTVTVPILRVNQNGATSADYSVPAQVVFNSGDTEKTIAFEAVDDSVDDDGESVRLSLGTLPPGVTDGTHDSAVVAITDDDAAGLVLSRTSVPVDEGDSATFTVKLATQPTAAVTVTAVSRDTSAVSVTGGSSLTFTTGDWSTAQTVTVFGVEDNDAADETAVVDLSGSSGGYGSVTGAVTVSVDDDDAAGLVLSRTSVPVDEGDSATFTVKLATLPTAAVTVTAVSRDTSVVSVTGGSSLTFTTGDWSTAQTVTVFGVEDNDAADETAVVDLEAAGGGYGSVAGAVTVSVDDDDGPAVTVSFEQDSYSVAEGSTESIKLVLSADPERTVTVPILRVNQNGATAADYSVPSQVVFNSGDTEKSIAFEAVDDSVDDDGESVQLWLGTLPLPPGVTEGTHDSAVVSIVDDDTAGLVLSRSPVPVDEGDSATFTVKLATRPTADVTVTAASRDTSVVSVTGGSSLTFTTGDWSTAQTVTVFGVEDADAIDTSTVVDLQAAGGGYGSVSRAVTVSVDDDDSSGLVLSRSPVPVDEGSTATFTVKLGTQPAGDVTVTATSRDTSAVSVSAGSRTLTFTTGDWNTAQTVRVGGVHDNDAADETAVVDLQAAGGGYSSHSAAVTVNVADDDGPAVTVSFEQDSYSVAEGSTESIKLTLSADPERTVTVPILRAHRGGATSADYSVPTQVVFNSGDTEKTIAFSAVDDSDDDDGESVQLAMGTLPPGVTDGTHDSTLVTIIDGDMPQLTVSFQQASYRVAEGETAEIVVVLNTVASQSVTIPLRIQHQDGAKHGDDYVPLPTSVTFAAGTTTQSLTFTAAEDTQAERDERVIIDFQNLPQTVEPGAIDETTVTIMDRSVRQALLPVCNNQDNKIVLLDAVGEIEQPGELDIWRVNIEPYRSYLVELLGARSGTDVLSEDTHAGDLTLKYPDLFERLGPGESMVFRYMNSSPSHPDGQNSIAFEWSGIPGTLELRVGSWHDTTGTYQIKVRLNNICAISGGQVIYPYAGGPDGFVADLPADVSTSRVLQPNGASLWLSGFLGDNWDSNPDVDWYEMHLDADIEYTLQLWADDEVAARHRASQLKIISIYDMFGDEIPNTSSPASGQRVSVAFQPDASGTYFVAVGSDQADPTGMYKINLAVNSGDAGQQRGRSVGGDRSEESAKGPNESPKVGKATRSETPSNTPAVGAPTIGGTARVGEALIADTSGISDADGLQRVTFSYQWLADNAAIATATNSSYVLTDTEAGKTMTVTVTFVDDAGNPEALTSSATPPVTTQTAQPPPAPQNLTATINADGSITLNWDAPDDSTVTGYQILRRRPTLGEKLSVYVENTNSTETTFTDTNVTAGIRHNYRVKAINEAGPSRKSKLAQADP